MVNHHRNPHIGRFCRALQGLQYNKDRVTQLQSTGKLVPGPNKFPCGALFLRAIGTPSITVNMPLIRRTGKVPINAETPAQELLKDITPNDSHYVRNHGIPPDFKDGYYLEIYLGENETVPCKLSLEDIKSRGLPEQEIDVTMACDGNRRGEINRIKRTHGFDWGCQAVSTARWKGIFLRDLLLDLFEAEALDQYGYVRFESVDRLKNGPYGTSIPMARALDKYQDALLAYGMNGEPLPIDHGYPLRTILPGCVGGRTVKWLKKITIAKSESPNWYHIHDNRVLPPDLTNSGLAADHWKNPRYMLYYLNLNSAILTPGHKEKITVTDLESNQEICGFAYDGAGREVRRVEISLDGGERWLQCNVQYPEGYSPRHGTRYWVMSKWSIQLPKWKVIACSGIIVRAWNESMNTQPAHPTWNLMGMMNNSWYRVQVRQTAADHVTVLHPISTENDGWMDEKYRRRDVTNPPNTLYFWEEVKRHTRMDDCWIVVNDVVYDVTDFLHGHPGGAASILVHAGRDVTGLFTAIHSDDAFVLKNSYTIGQVTEEAVNQHVSQREKYPHRTPDGYPIALNPRRWIDVTLKGKHILTKDTRRFLFELPGSKFERPYRMWLPWGKHVNLACMDNGNMVVRAYTPVKPVLSSEDDGTFELIIKVYFPTHDKPGGEMTTYLDNMNLGDSIKVKGPEGYINYMGDGNFHITGYFVHCDKLNFIVGGSGITPAMAVIRAIVLAEQNTKVKISLVFANSTVSDILCREELEELSSAIQVCHVIARPDETVDSSASQFEYEPGYVNEAILRKHCFDPHPETLCLVCGPPGLIAKAIMPNLEKIGHDEDHIFEF